MKWEPENRNILTEISGPGKNNISRIDLKAGEVREVLIGLSSAIPLGNNLYYSDSPDFFSEREKLSILFFLFYGFTLAFSIQALFLAFMLRRRSYLYFSGFNIALALCLASTDGFLNYLAPTPFLDHWVFYIKFFQGMAWFFVINFSYRVMEIKQRYPGLQNTIWSVSLLNIALGFLSLSPFYNFIAYLMDFITLITIICFLSFGIKGWHSGHRPSRYLILGWSSLFASGFILTLLQFGDTVYEYKVLIYLASCSNMIMMSMGLTSYIDHIEEEKNSALQIALENQKQAVHHLREIDTLKASFVSELEKKIDERTRELGHAQAHMVQMAKWKALGKMANGIAHEINNPLMII